MLKSIRQTLGLTKEIFRLFKAGEVAEQFTVPASNRREMRGILFGNPVSNSIHCD